MILSSIRSNNMASRASIVISCLILFLALDSTYSAVSIKKAENSPNRAELDEPNRKIYKRQANASLDICGIVESEKSDSLSLATSRKLLLFRGEETKYGDNPWHVALYAKMSKADNPLLICGGTLISLTVVVSGAHCFYNRRNTTLTKNVTGYEIYVGKFTREYAEHDHDAQKIHKIRELIYYQKEYNPGLTRSYGSDIVLIILEEPITVSKFVRPICLDWDNSIFEKFLQNQTKGRVVGWGLTSDGKNFSNTLLTADLPYISYDKCMGKASYLGLDNFCAGSESNTDPGIQKGDGGGGFVFKYNDRYYIQGIASFKNSMSSIGVFADLSFYTSWIRNYV